MTSAQEELAEILLATRILQFGQFRLKLHETHPEAPLSPLYFNFRRLRSYPYQLARVAQLLAGASQEFAFDLLADVPTGATPLTTVLAQHLNKPMVSPRQSIKSHGLQNQLDGVYEPGQCVLVVDDLITTGKSLHEALEVLLAHGLRPVALLVILDREQGGAENLSKFELPLRALARMSEVLPHYAATGLLSAERLRAIQNYLANPLGA
jgi:uridine monophosphate synthetase